MKRIFSKFSFKLSAVLTLAALAAGGAAIAAWGPERPTYTVQNPAPHVTFNSITNNADYGDERTFFDVKDAKNTNAGGFVDKMNVKDGQELLLRVYVHNNAADHLNGPNYTGKGVAKNTKVRIHLPTATEKAMRANAYISADNAQPQVVYDTVDFVGPNGEFFALEYIPGSAVQYTNAKQSGMKLSDSIVTTGATIGYDKLDGNVPGCFKYTSYVNIKVKVKMPRYHIEKQVGIPDKVDWKESRTAKAGDTVSWLITFKNTGATQLKDVAVVDDIPEGLTVVPGTVKLTNGNYPNGYTYPNTAIQKNGRQINIGIGNYNPGAAGIAYVTFRTKIAAEKDLKCGKNTIVNRAFATPAGYGSINDVANVVVNRECKEEPKPKQPVCDLLELKKLGGRKIEASVKYTANGATFRTAKFDFGDGSEPLTTNQTTVNHTYEQDGNYTVTATLTFRVGDKDVTVGGADCAAQVSFKSDKPEKPEKPEKPRELPKTGVGSVVSLFTATTVAGAAAHRLFSGRRGQ